MSTDREKLEALREYVSDYGPETTTYTRARKAKMLAMIDHLLSQPSEKAEAQEELLGSSLCLRCGLPMHGCDCHEEFER